MRRPDAAARRVLDAFGEGGGQVRVHTTIRWWTCPFAAVEQLVPRDGDVLDLGCGHGHFSMYLALTSPGRRIVGVDIDGHKIAVGTRVLTRAGLGGRVDLRVVESGWTPEPNSFDAVVTNDVLYLMGRERAARALSAMAAATRPGGTVVVKEMGATPRWKHRVNDLQERLATRVLGITEGDELEVLGADEIEDPLVAAGLGVRRVELHRGYTHAHLAVVGTRR